MSTKKSNLAIAMDELQTRLRLPLKEWGFRKRGRTFNRTNEDGLTEVINFQMGSFDPPGTYQISGFHINLYGKFTVNVGVFIPEVGAYLLSGKQKDFFQEYDCCIRSRIGLLGPEQKDLWWEVISEELLALDLRQRIERNVLPFFSKFNSRDAIVAEGLKSGENSFFANPPRIVCAIILVERGERPTAHRLLRAQATETRNPGHPEYVRKLAARLGLGELDTAS